MCFRFNLWAAYAYSRELDATVLTFGLHMPTPELNRRELPSIVYINIIYYYQENSLNDLVHVFLYFLICYLSYIYTLDMSWHRYPPHS
jgi:hypothetical protein